MSDIVERLKGYCTDYDGRVMSAAETPLDTLHCGPLLEAAAYIERLRSQVATLESAARFVAWAMRAGPWDGCELDGADVQEKALELGLIVQTKYDPAIHGENDYGLKAGGDWYVLAPEVAAFTSKK